MGSRVLIIESDLRRPTLAARMHLQRAPGLAEVLISAATVEEAIRPTPLFAPTNGGAPSKAAVHVLVAGISPPNPAELIESQAMEHLLQWAATQYELVLIDTPPLSVVSDAVPLVRQAHGVVIVSRLGKNTRDAAEHMRDELISLGAPVLGVVANGCDARKALGYYYEYAAPANARGGGTGGERAQTPESPPIEASNSSP